MSKERPILFSGPMVRAILDGRKTQTRRIVKPQPKGTPELGGFGRLWFDGRDDMNCPHGLPGDRMWVRETFAIVNKDCGPVAVYCADGEFQPDYIGHRWSPSIHMPRWASRISLEVISVRVERLCGITEADAKAEGAEPSIVGADLDHLKYRAGFQTLWESINGDGSWALNPWVWVLEFKRADDRSAAK